MTGTSVPTGKQTSAKPPRVTAKPGAMARKLAAQLLAAVTDDGLSLDHELDAMSERPAWANLAPLDRGLVRALVGTTLRRLGLVDEALRQLMDRKLPDKAGLTKAHLRIGAGQILFMEIPDHAAVSIAVDLVDADVRTRAWKGMVNGVLRNLARRRDEILAGIDADRHVLPLWLWRRWSAHYGEPLTRRIGHALLDEPPLDLTARSDPATWAETLGGTLLPTGSIRLGAHAPIDQLPGFTEGAWWVQDAAAALPARLLGPVDGLSVADLCAAPGGKTAQLAAAGARVTAVDQSAARMKRLSANLGRLRLSAECVTADLETWEPTAPFDAILLDAPCSATGIARRHPDVLHLKATRDLAPLLALQARLLERTVEWLEPGGRLVFATCSLEPEEGERQIERLLGSVPAMALDPVRPDELPAGLRPRPQGWVRTLPGDLPGGIDGFFIARLRRTA